MINERRGFLEIYHFSSFFTTLGPGWLFAQPLLVVDVYWKVELSWSMKIKTGVLLPHLFVIIWSSNFPLLSTFTDGFFRGVLDRYGSVYQTFVMKRRSNLDPQRGLHAIDFALCEAYTFGIRTLLFAFLLYVREDRPPLNAKGRLPPYVDTATFCVGVLAVGIA